ncbi:MAG: hypothetical protein AAB217_22600, partial [Chloroflexota bacterium]
WADPEGEGWLAAIALNDHPDLGRESRLLVVDGFDEFNPTQIAVLEQLAPRAQETLITLTGDRDRRRLAHRRFHRAEQQLMEALKPEVVWQIADGREAWPGAESPLRHLEAQLFEPAISNDQSLREASNPQSQITFLEAQTRSAEARAALRWIKQQIVEAGVPIGETAILARALDPYRPFLEETAREFGLPLRLVGGSPLAESPVVSALLALLSVPVVHPWRPRDLLAVWRSPYFDWPALSINPAHAATLDAVSRLGRVVEGLDQWREALARYSQPPAETLDDEPENVAPSLPVEAVAAARTAFERLAARLTPPARASLRDYVAFVEDLIGDDPTLPAPRFGQTKASPDSLNIVARAVAASDRSTAARDLAALRAFKECLRGLLLSESLVSPAPREWEYPNFLRAIHDAVASEVSNLQSLAESNGVFVASVLDARGLSFRAVAILGLAEGEFPQAEREMPLLRETDRAALRQRGLNLDS